MISLSGLVLPVYLGRERKRRRDRLCPWGYQYNNLENTEGWREAPAVAPYAKPAQSRRHAELKRAAAVSADRRMDSREPRLTV